MNPHHQLSVDRTPDGKPVLYHFTSRWQLPRIMREGIRKGDVPIALAHGFSAPWLTTDGRFSDQREWAKLSVLDKTEVRLRVVLPLGLDDPRLLNWQQVCERYKIEGRWERALGYHPPQWLVRLNGVTPSEIVGVDYAEGLAVLDGAALPQKALSCLGRAGTSEKPSKLVWDKLSAAEFVAQGENWVPMPGATFPWMDMPAHLVVALATGQLENAAPLAYEKCERLHICMDHSDYGRPLPPATRYPTRQALLGMAHWLRSTRRIVTVSTFAIKKLTEELPDPRFWSIPRARTADEAARLGQMFHIHLNPERHEEYLLYLEPVPNREGVRYCCWGRTLDRKWGVVVPRPFKAVYDEADIEWEERWQLAEYSSLSSMLGMLLGCNTDATRIDLTALLKIGINAYAAINDSPNILVGHRNAPKPKGGEVQRGLRDIKRLTLSEDATHLVTRRWITIDAEKREEAQRAEAEERAKRPHGSPSLHTVQPHDFQVWVKKPLAHERILGEIKRERQVKNKAGKVIRTETYSLFRVVRRRTGPEGGTYTRGSDVKPKKAALVTGPDDLTGAL